jgi:glycine/D-amino acid oxidase-like deaminating enzyme
MLPAKVQRGLSKSAWWNGKFANILEGHSDRKMMNSKAHIVVVGSGAFGGWTALYLLRRGARVTLLDSWGPGNSCASSGGETRVIRGTYGANQPYTKMVVRALALWEENERRWKRQLLHRIGVLWMVHGDEAFERGSLPELRAAGIRYEELPAAELQKRWPQINFEGVRWGIFEPESGYLTARVACQTVVEGFVAEGGEYKMAAVSAPAIGKSKAGKLDSLVLSDGSRLAADEYVFACGPWMGKLFPEVIGDRIRPTKQDVFFFGSPAGDARFDEKNFPVWADHREQFLYGIPGNQGRGFKVADDTRGPAFDPTSGERVVSPEKLRAVREYLGLRFPALKDAPLVETRVCQYEDTPDENFIIDRHPGAENVWLIGGGSGHGFKHGPALGEMVAGLVLEDKMAEAVFRLERFEKK